MITRENLKDLLWSICNYRLFALFAGFLAILAAVTLKRSEQKHIPWIWAGFFFILFALEEISWGGRFLRFPYLVILGEPIDGIHDIPFLIRKVVFNELLFSQKIIFVLLIVTFFLLFMLWKKELTKRFFQMLRSLPAKMIFFGCVLLFLAQIIDIQVIPNPVWARAGLSFLPPTYVEEFTECLASICFLFAGIEKMIGLKSNTDWKS